MMLGVLALTGCGKKAVEEIGYGEVKNSVYENAYFGLKLPLPADWSVQDEAMRQRLADMGNKAIAGSDQNLKATLKASEQSSVNLLAAFQHPVGSPVPFNPNFVGVAEKVGHMPGIKRGKDYQYQMKKLMEMGQIKMNFAEETTTEKLGGVDFDVLSVTLPLGRTSVRQKYYTTIMKGYALSFVVTFSTDEEEGMLAKIMQGMTFN